jgi:Leucine-rich repeat (LRR) protein
MSNINLFSGFIEMISPSFFGNLKNLEVIDFRRNECIDDFIKSTNPLTNIKMPLCFLNCAADLECAAKTEKYTKLIRSILNCTISTESKSYWGEFKYCEVHKVDLSNNSFVTKFVFDVAENESKKIISAVQFFFGRDVDFIPSEILQQISELNGLLISRYKIPTLKNNLFPIQFKKLEYLDLSHNRIQIVEPFVFQFLTELKWLDLNSNLIKILPNEFLINNLELIFIKFFFKYICVYTPGNLS